MSISVKILESNAKIQELIYSAIASEANAKVKKNAPKTRDNIKSMIPKWIFEQPEMQSLLSGGSGSLTAQFGIPIGEAQSIVQAIGGAVANAMTIDIDPVNKKTLTGGIEFRIQPTTYNNLLDLDIAKVTTKKGQTLEWLDWLLLKGTQMIVMGYTYEPGTGGRSGGGTMTGGGSWRVPPQYAGVSSDNFITRALSGRDSQLTMALKGLLK